MKETNAADVIVIGAGLQGCSTALQLAIKNRHVIVIEKDTAGRHASGVNAGGVRRLYRALEEIPLSVEAQKMWHQIEDLVGTDCGFQASGQLKLAENEQDMQILLEREKTVSRLGYNHEKLVDRETVREWVPNASEHCIGGIACFEDGSAKPYLTTQAFHNRAKRLGVLFYENNPVSTVSHKGDQWVVNTRMGTFQAPVIVNCAGAWGGTIAKQIGDPVPITPVAFCMMVTNCMPAFLDPVVSLTQRKLSFKQMPNGTVVIGGGHTGRIDSEISQAEVDYQGLQISADTVCDVFPIMKQTKIVRSWAGIEGVMPDMIPVISKSPSSPNAFHAFGFSAHGFQLSPIIGAIMAELIIDGWTQHPIDPFRVDRFKEDLDGNNELKSLMSGSIS